MIDFVFKMMNFAFQKAKSAVYKAPSLALRSLDLLWSWMIDDTQAPPGSDLHLKMMNFPSKMMHFVLKMMN